MAPYRYRLPQIGSRLFLTDGGIETALVFSEHVELPLFAAFTLLKTDEGRSRLRRYFRRYVDIARNSGLGLILETPTSRANPDWGARLGYSATSLEAANRSAVVIMEELRDEHDCPETPVLISGCVGPRHDVYDVATLMNPGEARIYHAAQIKTFAESDADLITAISMNHVNEAVGITQAARAVNMPVVLSFVLGSEGNLPSGQDLAEAIEQTDHLTGRYPAYYMINCAHPDHFDATLGQGGQWLLRLRGIRASASSETLKDGTPAHFHAGDPEELARQYAGLRRQYPHITVLGGCCGTDHRHVREIALTCQQAA